MLFGVSTPQLPASTTEPRLLPASESELDVYYNKVCQGAKGYAQGVRFIGWYGWRIRLANSWKRWGFEDEDTCREALDVPRSTWYKWISLAEACQDLPFEDFIKISCENLELLKNVPSGEREQHDWLNEAKEMKPAKFAELITKRNESRGSYDEPMTYFREKVVYTTKQFIERALQQFASRYGLSSRGRALELIIADSHDRNCALGAIAAAYQLIMAAQDSLHAAGVVNLEASQRLNEAKRVLNEAHESAVQSAKNAKSYAPRTYRASDPIN